MYNLVQMSVHISICFVMHNFVRMTMYNIIDFRHAHLCMNDYPYSFRFLSWTSLYEWLSRLLGVFVMHISVRMNILFPISNEHRHNKHLAGLASGCLIRLAHAWHMAWHTLGTRHKLRMTFNDLHPENKIALNNDHNFC